MSAVQLSLEAIPEPPRKLTPAEQFELWLSENQHVYRAVVQFAREWKASGETKGAIGHIIEVLRWQHRVKGNDDGPWSLNNNVRSRLARRVMADCEDLAGFFDVRTLRDEVAA